MSLTSFDAITPRPLTPISALLFHSAGGTGKGLALVTAHRVYTKGKRQSLDAGRPLAPEDERHILSLLDQRTKVQDQCGWVPEGLLAESGQAVLWFVPGRLRTLLLRNDNDAPSAVLVHTPNLVFALDRKQTLSVAAVATAERPGPDTPVFHAPLPNIYSDGTVCYGSATLPVTEGRTSIPAWNTMFYDASVFTHANHANWIAGTAGRDADDWWRRHAATRAGKRPFPAKLLVPFGATLAQWWQP